MFNEIPIFEQILRNFTAAINSSSPLAHASNLRNQALQHEILSNERKKERHEGRCLEECLERGQVVRTLQLGGAYLSNVGLLTLGPWPAKSLSSILNGSACGEQRGKKERERDDRRFPRSS